MNGGIVVFLILMGLIALLIPILVVKTMIQSNIRKNVAFFKEMPRTREAAQLALEKFERLYQTIDRTASNKQLGLECSFRYDKSGMVEISSYRRLKEEGKYAKYQYGREIFQPKNENLKSLDAKKASCFCLAICELMMDMFRERHLFDVSGTSYCLKAVQCPQEHAVNICYEAENGNYSLSSGEQNW